MFISYYHKNKTYFFFLPSTRAQATKELPLLQKEKMSSLTQNAVGVEQVNDPMPTFPSRVYFRQLLSGRDHSKMPDPQVPHQKLIFEYAKAMCNYQYLIGDKLTNECVVVDACWDVAGILECAKADGMKVTKGLCTHFHFDHVGGKVPKWMKRRIFRDAKNAPSTVSGIKEVWSPGTRQGTTMPHTPCYIHRIELKKLSDDTGIPREDLTPLKEGSIVRLGEQSPLKMVVLHTPGHSQGSVCFLLANEEERDGVNGEAQNSIMQPVALISGDTVFAGSCGRTDLPESNKGDMQKSLLRLSTDRALLPDKLPVFPGHAYGSRNFTTMAAERGGGMLHPIAIDRLQ